MNKTRLFLAEIEELQKSPVPEEVVARARLSLLDYIAVTAAGAQFQRDKIEKYKEFARPEEGEFTTIGVGKYALKEAVFLNGLNGHALDFDDGTNSGIIHLGSPIFSLLLPLAERYGIYIEKMLEAAIIGYETSYTIAVSIQPGHKALGFHATGTCGVLGATIAASYMLEFSEEERFQAFSTACASATGMLSVLDDGSELKPYNVAKTSLLALTSIQLAKAGYRGNPDPLGSYRGFLKMMTGNNNTDIKPLLLNGTYAIMKSYTKPYASCRYTHPSVEAAIHMRGIVKPDDIQRIDIKTYSLAVTGHDHTDILGSYSAKMSIPFATAVGLIYGKAGLQEFSDESVKNEYNLGLTKKIHVVQDQKLSSEFPAIQAAIVTITKKDGSILSERVNFPKGEPENPLNEKEFRDRYNGLMNYARKKDSEKIYELILNSNTKVCDVMSYL